MYAIVKNEDGTYYTSMVFGYYCRITAADDYQKYLQKFHNKFFLVLNEKKDRLIKKYVFPWEKKYLNPQVLITDTDQHDWVLDETYQGCVDFLLGTDFFADDIELDPSILGKCIAMDSMHTYSEIVEIGTEADVDNLMCVSGGFHDAYIEKCERMGDTLYLHLGGVWGCEIEMWFEGDVDYCIDSHGSFKDDGYAWYASTLLKADGYFYLVDESDMQVEDITDEYCWFRGRRLRYRVIPRA